MNKLVGPERIIEVVFAENEEPILCVSPLMFLALLCVAHVLHEARVHVLWNNEEDDEAGSSKGLTTMKLKSLLNATNNRELRLTDFLSIAHASVDLLVCDQKSVNDAAIVAERKQTEELKAQLAQLTASQAVALKQYRQAAEQAVAAAVHKKDAEIETLKKENVALQTRVHTLTQAIYGLTSKLNCSAKAVEFFQGFMMQVATSKTVPSEALRFVAGMFETGKGIFQTFLFGKRMLVLGDEKSGIKQVPATEQGSAAVFASELQRMVSKFGTASAVSATAVPLPAVGKTNPATATGSAGATPSKPSAVDSKSNAKPSPVAASSMADDDDL
jgi:hypothetical protein